MSTHDPLLEPFDAATLAAIQTAFAAAWHELCNGGPVPSRRMSATGWLAH